MQSTNLSTKAKLLIAGLVCIMASVALSATPLFPLVGFLGLGCFAAAGYLFWRDDPDRLSRIEGTYEHYKKSRDKHEREQLAKELHEQQYQREKQGR